MANDFDPNEYLKETKTTETFDPNAYLGADDSQKKSRNVTTNGANVVTSKGGEPQLEPSTVSGTKGEVEVTKEVIAPIDLPTSYTNDRNNKKDLKDGGKYNLLRGGKPIVGTWDAANDRFIKDKLIDYTPQEKAGEGFIEKASRVTGVKVLGGQLVKTDSTKPPKETEEEAFARATAEAEEIEKDVVKKVLNADYLTSYPQLQQLQQLKNQLELAPENKKAEISAKINELRVKKLDSDEFVGTRLKGDEEVYQNFMPAPRVGEELVPTTKDGLLKLPKTDMTIGEAYDEVVNDGEYVADATQEIQNLQQNLIDFKVSKLPEVDRKELDALRGTAEYDEAVTKKLAESEEVSNWFIAGAFGLKDKIDAIIRIGEGIGVDDEEAKAQAIRNIKRQEIFGIKPKTFGAEMTYSVGGMLPDIVAGRVYPPAMLVSIMSTMPSDFIDASVYEDYVNGRPIDMNKARKYATASTIAQGGLLMGAGKIGSHGLKIVGETNLVRSLELMTEMAKRGGKDAVLFGTLGHLMQNKINKAFKLAENDDYLKQSLHMAVIGMLFAFKEGSGKVIKLPNKAASEVDYLASYLPRDYTQKQVEQFVQMGKITASEGEAVLKKLDDYRLINAEFNDGLTQSELENIYLLWLQKMELKKSLVGQTSEMASHINGQIKDLDRKILIASRLPLTSEEKLEKQNLTIAEATGKPFDKYRLDYLNKRAEKYKEKQAELKAEEDEYKAKQELAKKAEEAKKVAETPQTGNVGVGGDVVKNEFTGNEVFYHGAKKSFDKFEKVTKAGQDKDATEQPIFLSEDKEFADANAIGKDATTMEVKVKNGKYFDFRKDIFNKDGSLTPLGEKIRDAVDSGEINLDGTRFSDYDGDKVLNNKLSTGDYDFIEKKAFIDWLKKEGYDGTFLREHPSQKATNLAVWNTDKLEVNKPKAVEQSLKETPTPKGNTSNVVEGSGGVGGDVGIMINPKERTEWKGYKVGDVIDGNKLDELSGDLVGNKPNEKFILVQTPLSEFTDNRKELLSQEKGYEQEEIDRLESMKSNFEKTPPIPDKGDGMHRIIVAKELGHETILQWKNVKDVKQAELPKQEKPTEPTKEVVKQTTTDVGEVKDPNVSPQPVAEAGQEGAGDGAGKQKTWGKLTKMPHQEGKGVEIDNAPDGNFINVGLQIGQTTELIPEGDVASNLPKDVKILSQTKMVDDFGEPFLSLELSRPLTKAELLKLQEATQQLDIPQLSGKKGTMYGTQQYGLFDPTKMTLPDGTKLSNATNTPSTTKNNFKPNKVLTGVNKLISKVADGYKKANRLFSKTPRLVTKVSDVDGKRIADAYEAMKHEPDNPLVKQGFIELVEQIKKQADALMKEGFKFELITEGKGYNSDSKKMLDDVKKNKRILIETADSAFGTKRTFDQDNIGLQDSGYKDVNGRSLTNVELIRAVHDLFGHSEYGNGFGAIGEENAWRVHMSMFTPLAQKALTATTRGQNSWVNFGNHMRNADGSIKKKGDAGYLEPNKRPFAEQKIGFLPDWAMENAYGDRVKINGKEIKPTNKYVVDGKEVYEIDDAQAFFDAISSAKESRGDDGIQVALKTKEEYQKVLDEGGVLLVSKDGNVGVMLEANGNVGSGFSHSDVPKGENSLKPLLITAIKLGGRFTDAYETYLPKYYAKFGFKPLYRMKFNPEFADKGWEKTTLKSEPDVVFMYFDGNRETLEADYDKFPAYDKTQGEYVTDYDKATEGARAKSIEIEEQASLTPPPDAKAGATKKEAPQTENKVQQASEQVQKFKDVLDQRTDKKTDKALKAFGEQAEKAKELIDNYDTNLKKLEEKGVEVKGTKEEILADMLDGKYDEALKSDTSIPSSKTEIERRPIQMLDGEEGIELIVKNEDGTETSMGKFYANDTKEMDKIERGLKLADQQKSKANENKTEIQKANEEVWKAIQDLLDSGDITNLGFAAKNVGEKSSEALDRLHKALVNSAKTYLKAGGTSLKQFAKNIGLSAKNAKQAWDEAMGLTTFNKDNLDYDLADIAKVAIRRGIKVREKLQEYKAKQKDVAKAIKAFMDDTEIKGALTPSQVKALVKRAASITTDAQFDKFIDYADKIIKDANLAQDLEDLRSNQKGAGKKRHNEKTADVRKFLDAEIFDEDGNLLLDEATFSEYSDAVAALNQKIPDHSLMEATDASGKTLSERVADQSQSASNPYMNINTVKDLMKAWTALDNNIVDVDSYKSFTRNISKIKARLKDLVQAGTIKQDDYDTAISQIYKHENGKRVYEAKYGDQIGQLKSAQIADAQAKARLVDDSGFNKMQKELWQEFKRNMSVNFEKFKKLEVSDLDKLNTVLDRMGNGFMPEYEFRQVMNKIETQGQGVKIAKQVAKISDKFKNNLDKLRDLFETNDPARYEGELGIAGDNSLWNGVLSRTQRALKKYTETTHNMYEKWYDSLPSFYKITGKKPVLIDKIDAKDGKVGKTVVSQREYDMVKVGAVRHMINHAAEMMAKGKDPIDVFGEHLADIKERQKYATEGELSILTDVYNKLKSNPDLLDINGELDYNKIWRSVEANDGKVLDVNQAKIESSFDGLDLEAGDMITSSNAIQGVNATKNPKHIRRYYVGTRVGEGEINESGQIGIRAGSSYARADKDMPSGAMLLNVEKIIQRQIKEAAKDYHLNQELDKLDYVFEEAKLAANREDINVLNEFQQDQRRIMQYHLSSGDIPPIFNKIQGGLYVKMLTTPYRLAAEAVSNTIQMMVRSRSFRGLLTALPSETVNPMYREMTDIMKATESTSLDHAEFRSMKNIETKDGQIQREGLLKRGVDVINGVTNAMAVGGMWMPNFNRKFAELTGENYNNSMLKNPKYVDAMREASSYADRETETVIGSTLKGGARREIVLTPFGGRLKADSTLGSLAKFLSNYPYRDTKELVRGINQMVTGVNEGRIDGAARSMGVVTNMMLYTGMYAITKSLWKQTFGDDDEKKEAKETIDRLSTKEGFVDFTKQEALSNAVNLAGTKYSQAGKMMTRLGVIALYNSNLLDETQKKDLANFAEAQLYMYFNKKSFRKSDAQSEFYNVIPHLKEASDIFYREVKGEEGVTALLKEAREKGVEGLTKDKQAQLSLLKNFIHTTNILLYSQGTQLPFSKDFVKSLDAQIKELNK